MLRRVLVMAALAVLAAPVHAQNARIEISIPYEFFAGDRKLASGDYTISRPSANQPNMFQFRGAARHQKAVVVAAPSAGDEPAGATEFVFARYGEAYFLRSFRIHGDLNVYAVPMSWGEKAAAKAGAEAVLVSLKAKK